MLKSTELLLAPEYCLGRYRGDPPLLEADSIVFCFFNFKMEVCSLFLFVDDVTTSEEEVEHGDMSIVSL